MLAEEDIEETVAVVTDKRREAIKSQKATAILDLIDLSYDDDTPLSQVGYHMPTTVALLLDDDFDVVDKAFEKCTERKYTDVIEDTAFLRTCPLTPRHGVLESRAVNEHNILDVWERLVGVMKKEDPEGCFLMQEMLNAYSSAVLHPNQYATFGLGHDGVTNESGLQLKFLMSDTEDYLAKHKIATKLGYKDGFEMEFVGTEGHDLHSQNPAPGSAYAYLTQIRQAPPPSPISSPFQYMSGATLVTADTEGSIPQGSVNVKKVWKPEGLVEVAWLEANITKGNVPKGFVIAHANGSMSSHIAAHARAHGIPYIVSDSVSVGDDWVEGSAGWVACEDGLPIEPSPYNAYSDEYAAAFMLGLQLSRRAYMRQHGWFAHFFHQWLGKNANGKESAMLAGVFVGWVVKATLSVCLAEMRHSERICDEASVDIVPTLHALVSPNVAVKPEWFAGPSPQDIEWTKVEMDMRDRNHWYAKMEYLDLTYVEMREALKWCAKMFKDGWKGGYGGEKWMTCASSAADIADAIIQFVNHKKDNGVFDIETLMRITSMANEAENWQHNNAGLFTKFLSMEAFDYATKNEETGKGLFSHRPSSIRHMFRTFQLYNMLVSGNGCRFEMEWGFWERVPKTPHPQRPQNDWLEILNFANNQANNTFFRTNLICQSEKVPMSIRDKANQLGPDRLHHSNKYTLNDDNFVPCGHEGCEKCSKLNVSEDDSIGVDTSMLLSDNSPSVFFALDDSKSSPITYDVCRKIRMKEFVSVEEFTMAWNGLVNTDRSHKLLRSLLAKKLKKQIAFDEEWVERLGTLMGGDE